MLKFWAKIIGGTVIGIVAGFTLATIIKVLFTDTTLTEYLDSLASGNAIEYAVAALVGIGAFLLSLAILIPAHEAGHLVCGLLTGYKFVSFRIFNLTFIKIGGKIRVKKFAVAGTGGQCLLSPPDVPLESLPTAWYNAGGVLANILLLLLALPLFYLKLSPYLFEAVMMFCLADAFLIIMNGIPMKLNGMGNDAYNMLYLRRNLLSKRALVMQLRTNALIQEGVRPKDMPEEWFEVVTDIDYKNPLEVSLPLLRASRLVDEMEWEKAYEEFNRLYSHRADIMKLYVNEMACELAFCAMITGRTDQARELLDDKLRKYIEFYGKTMSSKVRFLCAIALYLDGDRAKAEKIYKKLKTSSDKYLLQGEVASDLAIMDFMFAQNNHSDEDK